MTGAVPLAHFFLRERLRTGDRAVDATCGTGRDTLFLARLVGPEGKVWGFDIQEEALVATRALVDKEGCGAAVELVAAGHERLAEVVTEPVRAAVFNLGYLPGGDKGCTTEPLTTISALTAARELIMPGGLITIAVYAGHPGGDEECRAVEGWGAALPPQSFNVWRSCQLNRSPAAPFLVVVEKRVSTSSCRSASVGGPSCEVY